MTDKYFDSDRDRQIIDAGGFFCEACLISKPIDDMSYDPRYCLGCYEFLLKEAKLLRPGKKPSWVPVVDRTRRPVALPVKREVVTKIVDKGKLPLQTLQLGVMLQKHAGGRPKKEGEVTRMTEWRRQKADQGVLPI